MDCGMDFLCMQNFVASPIGHLEILGHWAIQIAQMLKHFVM